LSERQCAAKLPNELVPGPNATGRLTETATREDAIAGQVLAGCHELAVIAARIAPSIYIRKELGRGPAIPEKGRVGGGRC
jgi:hypothetical protein